ncbi:AraC family transcriptional regulator [Chryseosolibacter indicus]|uniref:AraC family transcriptional regulator n=1 Tax=Chryseosolibacter indicus TaxID=2782351 RepID=A0ABS5VVH7_9BACT|nr:AraC family transcriptional regulator [Chryseosolibacter indicus]MBT1705053.1 AraC family transcriptional regulator [Chryseosolibacter indicus]
MKISFMEGFQKKLILALLAYGTTRNVNPKRLCDLSGIKYAMLTQPPSKPIGAAEINSLWKNVSYLTNDPLFGLHFGESMQLAALGVVGQIVQTSATVGEALTNACSLTRLVTGIFSMKIIHNEDTFNILIIADESKEKFASTYRHMADYLTVFVVHELNGLLLEKIHPISVKFPYTIANETEYIRIFQCPISPNASEHTIEFPKGVYDQHILSADYELQNYLLQKISVLMKNSEATTLQTRIYNHLLSNTYLHTLSLEDVAANFNLSARTLQRKLKEEGVSYMAIVEDVRKTLAINYIDSRKYTIKDIAHILGYNEQSAFLRAFKRWTGTTPKAYTANN